MTALPVILRGSPGVSGWRPPGPEHRGQGLGLAVGTYIHAAGLAGAGDDRFGMGAVLVARGLQVIHALLVVPDDIEPATRSRLVRWGDRHRVGTLTGPAPWRVVSLGDYCSPTATRDRAPWAFVPNAYTGASPVLGCDLGRTLGLCAEHVVERSGASRGTWTIWLPGWGRAHTRGRIKPRSPNRPPMYLRSRRVGWSVSFAPCERGRGKRTKAGPWRGEFVDLLSAAYALDADRSAGFVEHARNFKLEAGELPVTVTLDDDGAAQVTEAVRSVHALGLAVDAEAGRWFTNGQDRAEQRRRLPLVRVQSPAAVADHLLRQCKVDPPLRRFALRPEDDAAWWEAFHGGWVDDFPILRGRPFGAVALDLSSAYPLTAHLIGWWDVMTAERLVGRSVLRQVRALCRRAVDDPAAVLDPEVWERLGLTVCEVIPDGEPFPVALDDPNRPDGRTETLPVTARGRSMFYGWADVLAAAVMSGRVPRIVRALRLVPEGRQDGLRRRVPVYAGLTIDTTTDPVVGLVRRRRQAKADRDDVLAAELHALVNSLVSGNPSRLDDVLRAEGNGDARRYVRREVAGPWTFAPLAVTVTAGARLLLAVLDRQVRDLGGVVVYRDTDSSVIPASPQGGTIELADGSSIRELSDAEVDRVLGTFDALSPDPEQWPVWKRDPKPGEEPMRSIIFGPKRHVSYRGSDQAPELVDWTEAALGGMWADPSGLRGRCPEGGRAWSKVAVAREITYAAAKAADPDRAARQRPSWDDPGDLAFPALRRLAVTSPALLATLPEALGARAGSRYLEAIAGGVLDASWSLVARDPGGPLDDWADLDWLDRETGDPVMVSTRFGARTVEIESLGARAGRYGDARRVEPVAEVIVAPLAVVYRGRVSPVLDASGEGTPGGLARFRVRYDDAHGLGPGQREALVALARSMTSRTFARVAGVTPRVTRQIAGDRLPCRSTVEHVLAELRRSGAAWIVPGKRTCGLDECDHPVDGRRTYCACCPTHAEAGRKRRQRAAKSHVPGRSGAADQAGAP